MLCYGPIQTNSISVHQLDTENRQNTHQPQQWVQTVAEGNRPGKCWIRACEPM